MTRTPQQEPDFTVIWEAPPPTPVLPQYDKALATVKERPGDWARIALTTQASAYNARKRLLEKLNDERWEMKTVKVSREPVRYGLYVRYRTPEQLRAAAT